MEKARATYPEAVAGGFLMQNDVAPNLEILQLLQPSLLALPQKSTVTTVLCFMKDGFVLPVHPYAAQSIISTS